MRWTIDGDDRICAVDTEYDATSDGSSDEGSSLWSSIGNWQVREIYRALLNRVRDRGKPVTFVYRCDTDEMRQLDRMDMTLVDDDGSVEFLSSNLREDAHPQIPDDRTTPPADDQPVVACSWCERFDVNGEWVQPEEAVRRLGLLSFRPPLLSHGACPDCLGELLALSNDEPNRANDMERVNW